jgi:hypothetical protein
MPKQSQNSILYPQRDLTSKMRAFIRLEQEKEKDLIKQIKDLNDQIKSKEELDLSQKIFLLDSLGIDTKIQQLRDIKSKIGIQEPITQEEADLFKNYLKIEPLDTKQEIDKKFEQYINTKYLKVDNFSERIENFTDISEKNVENFSERIKNFTDIAEKNLNENPPEKIIDQGGVCQGLSVLWSYGKILEDNQQQNSQESNKVLDDIKFMRDISQTLINWDGKSILDNDTKKNINDFIGNIRTYQSSIDDLLGINSSSNPNRDDYEDILGKTSHTDPSLGLPQHLHNQGLGFFETREKNDQGDYENKKINKTFDCALIADKLTLKNRLEKIIQPNTMNILGIYGKQGGHAVSLYKSKDESLYFYDPNRGESKEADLDKITESIQNASNELFDRPILMKLRCQIYNMNESKPIEIDKEKFTKPNLDEFKNFINTNKESNFDKDKDLIQDYLYSNIDHVKKLIDSQDKGVEDFMKNNDILKDFPPTDHPLLVFKELINIYKESKFSDEEQEKLRFYLYMNIDNIKSLIDSQDKGIKDFMKNNDILKDFPSTNHPLWLFKELININKESKFSDEEQKKLRLYLEMNIDNIKSLIDSQDKGVEDFIKNHNILKGFNDQNIKDFSKTDMFRHVFLFSKEMSNLIDFGLKPEEIIKDLDLDLFAFIIDQKGVIELLKHPHSVKLNTIKILSDLAIDNELQVEEFIKDPSLVQKLEKFLESKDDLIKSSNLDKKFLSGLIINESLKSPDSVKNFLEGEEKDVAILFNLLKNKQGKTTTKDSQSNNPEEIFNIFINSDNSSKAESIVKYNDIIDKNRAKEKTCENIINANPNIIQVLKGNCIQSNQSNNQEIPKEKLKNEITY